LNKRNIILIASIIVVIALATIATTGYLVRQHQVAKHQEVISTQAKQQVQQDIDAMNKKYNYKPK